MFERSPRPLLALKVLGTLCPCLEKEEDAAARHAAWAVSSVPVRWHRRLRGGSSDGGGAAGAVGGFISGMFGSGSGGGSSLGGDSYEPLEGATLSVVDSSRGPQLVASPRGMSAIRPKGIPLRLIKKVQARKGGVMKAASRSGIKILDAHGRTVLKFDVVKPSSAPPGGDEEEGWDNENGNSTGEGAEDAEESVRDDIIDQLEILIEWERRRQAYIVTLGEDDAENDEETQVDEYDDDDGESPSSPSRGGRMKGVLAEKAQKMKHFAQREIELQKMKKDRENRKAKYVKEAGGLKYTAIAMANRS